MKSALFSTGEGRRPPASVWAWLATRISSIAGPVAGPEASTACRGRRAVDRLGDAVPAGAGDPAQIDVARRRRLAADRVVRAVVEHDVAQVRGAAGPDDREAAHVHQRGAVAVEADAPAGAAAQGDAERDLRAWPIEPTVRKSRRCPSRRGRCR